MNAAEHAESFRVLILITSPKLADKAAELYREGRVPIEYRIQAHGTASSETMDLLGLGSPEKVMLVSMTQKAFALKLMAKLKEGLRLGTVNSGIAFTCPINGGNSLIFRLAGQLDPDSIPLKSKEDAVSMTDMKYALVAAVVNQGFSEDVMSAARKVGAAGGTVISSRRISGEDTVKVWGLSLQQEKETILILTEAENKGEIMRVISAECGMHSEAKGIVLSMPIDGVIGLGNEKKAVREEG